VKETLNRPQLIERTGLAIEALGLPLLLAACTSPTPAAATTSSSGGSTAATKPGGVLPTYIPFPNKPRPEHPSSSDRYLDGYDNFPKDPAKAIDKELNVSSLQATTSPS
jgi:hypothetical protein